MSLLLIVVTALVVWLVIASFRRRLDVVEDRLADAADLEKEVAELTRRVQALEGLDPAVREQPPVSVPLGPQPPAVPAVVVLPPSVPVRDVAAPRSSDAPVVLPPTQPTSVPKDLPAVDAAPPAELPVVPVAARDDRAAASEQSETWEVVVGTSWLNKIGVLILVTGLALLLGYSMTSVGPLGRVFIGFALSAAMLGTGVVVERRPPYRAYGYGLIAGGWAGAYVTTFAMRAIPAARVIDSDAAGLAALLVVAMAMVVHSLRYRSETVTTLAYVAAYLPLAFTPLTGFSLAASVPLVISLLVVAQRFGWSTISILGVASTYGVFALRGRVLPGDVPDPTSLMPYLVLAVYWLTFEAADLIGLRSRRSPSEGQPAPLFALNAVGGVGAALMMVGREDTGAMAVILGVAAAAYLASAIVRARLFGRTADEQGATSAFSSAHAAVALGAGMMAWAIDLRMAGPRETLALLIETQLLVAAGVTLSDRHIRRIGMALGGLVTIHALSVAFSSANDALTWPWVMSSWTPVVALVAAAWYTNREWLRRRSVAPGGLEFLYPWAALLMVGTIIALDFRPDTQGLAGLLLGLALLEAGIRRAAEYRVQSYVVFGVSGLAVVGAFALAPHVPSPGTVWAVLGAAMAAAYTYAWRLGHAGVSVDRAAAPMAAAAVIAGTLFLVILEWRVTSPGWLGVVWAATAMALVVAGSRKLMAGLRWQAYMIFALAIAHASQWSVREIALAERAGTTAIAAPVTAFLVFGAAYAGVWFARRREGADQDPLTTAVQLERLVLCALPALTTLYLIVFEAQWLATRIVPAAWTATAMALLAAGLKWRAIDLRVQAYLVFAAGTLASFVPIMQLPESQAVPWIGLTVAGLYATGLLSRSPLRAAGEGHTDSVRRVEAAMRVALLVAATGILVTLIAVDVRPTLITMGWGLQGTVLLLAGFVARERALRLAGLSLLFLCILKLFLYDLRELEALPRILSFVVLGLVLLGVSWTYTRYKEQLRKLF